jgi:REP element-mobilizing transposase RayT
MGYGPQVGTSREGYVVMPEHVHLLFSEPERGDPSVVMKVLKQSFAQSVSSRS